MGIADYTREKTMPTFTINGHNLYYETQGDPANPPLVLLQQGLGASMEWASQMATFSDDYHVIVYDRCGYGRSDPRPHFDYGYLLPDTDEAIALLDSLDVKEAFLLGHSDGGTLALLLAARRPDLVRAMAIEAAHIYYEPKIQAGIQAMLEKVRSSRRIQSVLKMLHGEKAQDLAEGWLTHWLDPGNVPVDLVAEEALVQVQCPVLVIQGEEDEYATPKHAEDIHAHLPNSELWIIPGCGHMPHVTLGEEFSARVAVFFREVMEAEEEEKTASNGMEEGDDA
jgi:pimeloyl-ACP methyl ester carboxylesterase